MFRSRYVLLSLRSRLEEMVKICGPEGESIGVIVANGFWLDSRWVVRETATGLKAIDAPIRPRSRGSGRHDVLLGEDI
jgi:hypothetical protein